MNNEEIKEILDRARNLKNKCSCCEQIADNVYVSRYHEIETQNLAEAVYLIDKLLDYITNLQEKTDNQKEEINRLLEQREKFMKKYDYLKEENERLKEQIKKDNHILGCNFASKDKYKQELEDYKSRNEKAIEYINKYDGEPMIREYYDRNLLNILGGDEE